MIYGSTTLATNFGADPWQVKVIKCLLFFIPPANPDNEPLYPMVKKWALEVNDSGEPIREVGIDAQGKVLFIAPDDRNFGFWTDSDTTFNSSELSSISAEEFEKLWLEGCKARDPSLRSG